MCWILCLVGMLSTGIDQAKMRTLMIDLSPERPHPQAKGCEEHFTQTKHGHRAMHLASVTQYYYHSMAVPNYSRVYICSCHAVYCRRRTPKCALSLKCRVFHRTKKVFRSFITKIKQPRLFDQLKVHDRIYTEIMMYISSDTTRSNNHSRNQKFYLLHN